MQAPATSYLNIAINSTVSQMGAHVPLQGVKDWIYTMMEWKLKRLISHHYHGLGIAPAHACETDAKGRFQCILTVLDPESAADYLFFEPGPPLSRDQWIQFCSGWVLFCCPGTLQNLPGPDLGYAHANPVFCKVFCDLREHTPILAMPHNSPKFLGFALANARIACRN